jgi:hypothetical protein
MIEAVKEAWENPLTREDLPPWRRGVKRLTESDTFHRVIMVMILVNTAVMSMNHYGMPEGMASTDEWISTGEPHGCWAWGGVCLPLTRTRSFHACISGNDHMEGLRVPTAPLQ